MKCNDLVISGTLYINPSDQFRGTLCNVLDLDFHQVHAKTWPRFYSVTSLLKQNKDYAAWLKQLKAKVRQVQLSAAVKVNQELLLFYWDLGEDILKRQKAAVWGDGFLDQLSRDLATEFPDMRGFSLRNLKYIRQWVLFWS